MKKESNFKRLMDLAGEHRYFSYACCILAAISAALALLPYYYIWRIIKELLMVNPNFSEANNIVKYGWLAVLFSFISMFIYILALVCSHKCAFRVQANMKIKMMNHIMKLPLGYIEKVGSGKIRKIVNDSSSSTETYLAHNLPDKVVSFVTPICLLVMMMSFDYRLGLFCLIPVFLAFVIMFSFMMGPKLKEDTKKYQDSLDNMSKEAVEYVRVIPVVKTFGQSIYSLKRFKGSIDDYEKWTTSYTKKMMIPMVLFTSLANSVFAFIIIAAFSFEKTITNVFALNIIFYILITSVLTVTLMKIAYASESNMIVSDSLERMDSILNVEPLKMTNNPISPNSFDIEVKDAFFSYDGRNNALNGISLNIKENEHIALIGPSGGGKTTLASLISRFWDLNSGEIKIGGVNIKDIDYKELMDTISYVFQDSKMLKMSILDNVKMGNPKASDDEIMTALEKAQCMDIINHLPDGVNTIIGSKGVYVSGGECQRLCIARALVKNAKILILDEATAFSDPDNEVLIQKAFENLCKEKTVIMIAHRLSTITNADCIYVIDDGKVKEFGKYNELINKSGIFKDMLDKYNNSVNWKVGNIND